MRGLKSNQRTLNDFEISTTFKSRVVYFPWTLLRLKFSHIYKTNQGPLQTHYQEPVRETIIKQTQQKKAIWNLYQGLRQTNNRARSQLTSRIHLMSKENLLIDLILPFNSFKQFFFHTYICICRYFYKIDRQEYLKINRQINLKKDTQRYTQRYMYKNRQIYI